MKTDTSKTARTLKRLLALIFAAATMLTLFVLPASAKSADGFQYYVDGPYEDDGEAYVTITGHKSNINGTLTIPAKLGGYTVWSVGDGAFVGRKDIKKVVISEGVGYIDRHAFEDCTNLRTLVVGDVYISSDAFSGCTSLKKVKITAYKSEFKPEYGWDTDGNDALFAADWEWTHYRKGYDVTQTELKTRTGAKLTLTAEYDKLRSGESYHWCGVNIYPDGDDAWEDCTGRTVKCTVIYSEEQTVVCEIRNSKGEVIRSEEFDIYARRSLADRIESAVYNTYLYGVAEYTHNHFHWKLLELLNKMGVDVYNY